MTKPLYSRPEQITGQTEKPTEPFEFGQFGPMRKQIRFAVGDSFCEFGWFGWVWFREFFNRCKPNHPDVQGKTLCYNFAIANLDELCISMMGSTKLCTGSPCYNGDLGLWFDAFKQHLDARAWVYLF